ncbi:hypothetical protein ZWY2020_002975 [Hordeum vulgare]|nr:hypothetical protein ZWY2020_002975 [Hordeum vulgare]
MMNSTQDPAVKKGSVVVTRMESITTYKNQHRQPRSGTRGRLRKGMTLTLARNLWI